MAFKSICAAVALTLVSCVSVPPSAEKHSARDEFLIQNARVFDGEKMLEGTSVLVRDGKIAAVGPDVTAPGATIIDGAGRTLLPGLIDSHVHLWDAEQPRQALALGVTTELDMMTAPAVAAQLRSQARHDRSIADVRSAGNPATSPGGHGTEYGLPIETLTSPAEAEAFVSARMKEGSDYLKIFYEPGRQRISSIDRATLQACIAAAHRHGLLAVVHISTLEGARDALMVGADGLAHVFADVEPTDEFIALARDRRAFVTPTLSVIASLYGKSTGPEVAADPAFAPFLAASAKPILMSHFSLSFGGSLANAQHAVARLAAAGVPILAGTDAPNPGTAHGATLHAELQQLVKAGLPPLQALAAVTSVPAKRFRLDDRGRIAPGLVADLVLVKGNPADDIRATRNIDAVWRGGARFDREAYRQSLETAQASARRESPSVAPGLVSDFEQGTQPTARFGIGWRETTDALIGGHSTASLAVVKEGANGSAGALEITGDVAPGLPYAWAGAMFMPGAQPMVPVDLSSARGVSFFTRGDGATYRVMVFAKRLGRMPAIKTFQAGAAWSQQRVSFNELGLDGSDIIGIAVCAGPSPGKFSLRIDDFTLEPAAHAAR